MGILLGCADAVALVSMKFIKADGTTASARYVHILAACGPVAVKALARVAAADKYIRGAYHVRPGGFA